MEDLQGQIAVVTGASRGIGKGTAIALGEKGATVYVTGRTTGDGERGHGRWSRVNFPRKLAPRRAQCRGSRLCRTYLWLCAGRIGDLRRRRPNSYVSFTRLLAQPA